MLIKAERTGRRTFGDKQDPTTKTITIEGVKITVTQSDTWSSGEYAGDGEYIRITTLAGPKADPCPNIKHTK